MGEESQKNGVERMSVYLHANNVFASPLPCTVTTILGSCVAVCLWDQVRRIGGMNHFLLPYGADALHSAARFGGPATRALIEKLVELGARVKGLHAKVFGGASVLGAFRAGETHLGTKNVHVARQVLGEAGIPIVGENVGGLRGRKMVFYTDDGSAFVKLL